MACKYKLTYFDMGGRGELSRLMFVLKGEAFEDDRIKKEAWPEYKTQTPFGWMPILSFNGKKYCDSMGIAKYLAREFGFGGKDNLEMLEIDQVLGMVVDIFTVVMTFYMVKDEAKSAAAKKAAHEDGGSGYPKFLGALEKILEENGDFYVGKSLTIADVAVMDAVNTCVDEEMIQNYKKYPLLLKNKTMVAENSKIKAYYAQK